MTPSLPPDAPRSAADARQCGNVCLALLIVALLASVYLVTYTGRFLITDEHTFVSTAASLAVSGRFSANQSFAHTQGLYELEPLHVVIGSLAYRLAVLLGLGVVHTLMLINVFTTALTAAVVFLLAGRLGFSRPLAVLGALLFGLATIAWPYTQTFFRDVTATLFLVLSVTALEGALAESPASGRQAGEGAARRLALAALAALFLVLGLVTKRTLVAALPGLAVYAALGLRAQNAPGRLRRRTALGGLAALAGSGALLLLVVPSLRASLGRTAEIAATALAGIVGALAGQTAEHGQFWQGLLGIPLSPGKGVFIYSPVLLLALPALAVARGPQRRAVLLALLVLAGFALTQAFYLDEMWWSGVGWGLRALLPAIPFLTIACLPVLGALWARPARWGRLLAIALVALSVGVQLMGVVVPLLGYYDELGRISPTAAWNLAVWEPYYSPVLGHARLLLAGARPDFAWLRLAELTPLAGAVAGLALLVAGLAALGLARGLRGRSGPPAGRAALGLALVAATVLPYGLLRLGLEDPAYHATRPVFQATNAFLSAELAPGDVVVVREYLHPVWYHFMNYAGWPVDWYGIGLDRPGPVTALNHSTVTALYFAAESGRRLWLVNDLNAENGPLLLEERWLTERYTPLRTVERTEGGGQVRLVLFAPLAYRAPVRHPAARFGERIELLRAQLSAGQARPGEILGVRLTWHVREPETTDYSAGVYLLAPDGRVVAQQDLQPRNNLQPFPSLRPGRPLREQRGFELPADLAPGRYSVAVAVYDWRDGTRLPVAAPGPAAGDLLIVDTVELAAP